MPNRRNTPKRRRMDCPECGRNISYTYPWMQNSNFTGLVRDYNTAVFAAHNRQTSAIGPKCDVNGPHGFGYTLNKEI